MKLVVEGRITLNRILSKQYYDVGWINFIQGECQWIVVVTTVTNLCLFVCFPGVTPIVVVFSQPGSSYSLLVFEVS